MKKITITYLLLITLYCNALAQKKLTTYLAGNFGLATAKVLPHGSTQISSKLSGGFGVHITDQLTKRFFIVAQPAISSRGYVSSNSANKYDISSTYIDIPAGIEYHFPLFRDLRDEEDGNLFFIGAGVYGGVAISGKYKDQYLTPSVSQKIKFGESTGDNRSLTDFGLNLVAGLTYDKIRFGIQYQKGLKNVVPKDRQTNGAAIYLRNFSMFVAYKLTGLKGKKK
jgi:hypothetical protein